MTSSALYCEKNIWHDVTSLPDWDVSTMETTHRVHWSINPLSERHPLFFAKTFLNLQTAYTPLF